MFRWKLATSIEELQIRKGIKAEITALCQNWMTFYRWVTAVPESIGYWSQILDYKKE